MKPCIQTANLCVFIFACASAAGVAAYEAGGHEHGEAGQLPVQFTGQETAYVDTAPPLWDTLGTLTYKVTTKNAQAQRYFDQGLRLTYAFNHLEAQRAFRAAQKLDPGCAMCFWGEALVLGPNINAPMVPEAIAPALKAIKSANALAVRAKPHEQGLIEALTLRYSADGNAQRKDLDAAYASAMSKLAQRFPEDIQIAVLYAESLMNLSPWDYWQEGGRTPKGQTAEILRVLEATLAKQSNHPGAIHYYIHMVEASDRPERAEPYANRLAELMPGAGHLVHMPGHLYYRLGRYRDALEANRVAIAVDEAYLRETGTQGLYAQVYYPHNVHFLMTSAQMAGDGKTALAAADKLAAAINDETARALPSVHPIKAAPYFAYAQYGTPDEVLRLGDPGNDFPYVQAIWHYARGVASARKGAVADARSELQVIARLAEISDFSGLAAADIPARETLDVAREVLAGRIAQALGKHADAIAAFEVAAAAQERLPYMEPPYWYYPVQRSLGALRLMAGNTEGAVRDFKAALTRAPNDAWALHGLAATYRKLGDESAATEAEQRLRELSAGQVAPVDMSRM